MMPKDDQLNFRINSELKQKFSQLCDGNRYSISEALTDYMMQCLEAGELLSLAKPSNATSSNVQAQINELRKRLDRLEGKAFALVK